MREFLDSEISQIESIPNIQDNLKIAIASGKNICRQILEPIQDNPSRISIRFADGSCSVNAKKAENQTVGDRFY